MKHTLTVCLLFILGIGLSQITPKWNWVENSTGQNGPTTYNDSYTDSQGNTYIVGTMGSEFLSFGEQTAHNQNWKTEFPQICAGGCPTIYYSDVFVVKIDKDGNTVWLQTIEGTQIEEGVAITANDAGEVWLLARSNGETVSVDNTTCTNTTDNTHFSFLVKLNTTGTPNYIQQIEGADANISTAWLFLDGTNLSIFSSFRRGFNSTIDIFSQNIPISYAYNTILKVDVNASLGSYISHKEIGIPSEKGSGSHQLIDIIKHNNTFYAYGTTNNADIQFDNQNVTFQNTEYSKYYIAQLNSSGVGSSVFEINKSKTGDLALNDNKIVLAYSEQSYPNFSNLISLTYYNHNGEIEKEEIVANGDVLNDPVSVEINSIIIDSDDEVTLALSITDEVTIDNTTYTIPPSVHNVDSHGITLTNLYSDIFLLNFDYNDGLRMVEQIEGNYLPESVNKLTVLNDDIRFIGGFESPEIEFDVITLKNENNIWFDQFHNEPTGLRRFNSLIVADLKINDDVVGLKDLESQNLVSLSPNPSTGSFKINSDLDINQIEVYSLDGRFIKSIENNKTTYSLPKGNYMLKMMSDESIFTNKLIIQ